MKAILKRICIIIMIMPFTSGCMSEMSKKSHVEDFEGVSVLFEAVTAPGGDGFASDWRVFSFPSNNVQGFSSANCTVVYLDQCISWNKCRQTCQKTGASSYRWFHDGCCECVGAYCLNYGINESRCSQCPEPECNDED
ncbi:protein twisted gastrulation [Drosophila busckii]|uniref:protein twisted gastrulation n=1 Tax=Drosophila busckii TaxID=30019 RepID=UPI00083F4166|nr:protein twisted gastrulation [Drosophila busckii]